MRNCTLEKSETLAKMLQRYTRDFNVLNAKNHEREAEIVAQAGKGGEIQLTDAMARSLDREAMYAVVIDPLSGYDTGTPSGWMATNALMAASDPRFASAFWDAIDERGGLMRK